jgi:hypothetical protein
MNPCKYELSVHRARVRVTTNDGQTINFLLNVFSKNIIREVLYRSVTHRHPTAHRDGLARASPPTLDEKQGRTTHRRRGLLFPRVAKNISESEVTRANEHHTKTVPETPARAASGN